MSDIIPSPRSRPSREPIDPAQTLSALATVVFMVLTVAVLYLAREILVPIAIAILLSFVLAPLVKILRKLGLGKTLAVGGVVFLTFLMAVGLGMILAKQISDLASDAPQYQTTFNRKIEGAQTFVAQNPILNKLGALVASAGRMSPTGSSHSNEPADAPVTKPSGSKAAQPQTAETKPNPSAISRKLERRGEAPAQQQAAGPIPVEIVPPAPGVLTIIETVIGIAASPIVTAAFVAIFIVFILMQREDLRNRFIRLVGSGDLQLTTLAMNDAARRLSRYFLAQVLMNMGFGIFIALALTLIGVPSAILWGIVVTFMRFIPYIGSIGSALFPVAMASVASSGWTMVLETIALFAIAEFIVGQILEPLVYGRNTGISPIAVVVSATFWTWLWGPVGLVLATPLTVCLVVMGRHVDRLAFLDVLLGDAPPLTPVETFYQRMLAGDPSEIVDHAETFLRQHTLIEYCDRVAMPALLMAQIDVRRGVLEEKRQGRIRDTLRDLVDDIVEEQNDLLPLKVDPTDAPAALENTDKPPASPDPAMPDVTVDPAWTAAGSIVCVGGRTALDEAAAHLLSDLLGSYGIGTRVEPAESLTANDGHGFDATGVRLIVLSFLDADLSTAHARFAVRRLRRRAPGVQIVSAFWMAEEDEGRTSVLCQTVRCDTCVSSLPKAIRFCLETAAEAKPSTSAIADEIASTPEAVTL